MPGQSTQCVVQMETSSGNLNQPLVVETPTGQVSNFAAKSMTGFSICQIVIGAVLLLLGVVSIFEMTMFYIFGAPIWCGTFILVTGIIGLLAARKKTNCYVTATMVCSIIAASVAGTFLVGLSVTAIIYEVAYGRVVACVLDSVVLLLAVIEIIISILSAAFCCRAVCCGRQYRQSMTYYYTGQPDMAERGNQVTPPVVMLPQGMQVINQTQALYDPPLYQQYVMPGQDVGPIQQTQHSGEL